MTYIFGVGVGIVIIFWILRFFLRVSFQEGFLEGSKKVMIHIFKHIKEKGSINLVINGKKIKIIEDKEK